MLASGQQNAGASANLPRLLDSRMKKQRLAVSTQKIQLMEDQKRWRIAENQEVIRRMKEAQQRRQKELQDKEAEDEMALRQQREAILRRIRERNEETRQRRLDETAAERHERQQREAQEELARERKAEETQEKLAAMQREEELKESAAEEERQRLDQEKARQSALEALRKEQEREANRARLEKAQQEAQMRLEKLKKERLERLKQAQEEAEMEKRRKADLWKRQKEAEEMERIKKLEEAEQTRLYIEERKLAMREMDCLKQTAQEKIRSKTREREIAEEIERNSHAPPIQILLEKPTQISPSIKPIILPPKMSYTAREEHTAFYQQPRQLVQQIKTVQCSDPLKRIIQYHYADYFSLEIDVQQIRSQLTSEEKFDEESRLSQHRQQTWIGSFKNFISEQIKMQSPSLEQLRMILKFEQALLPAFEFCRCVGDFLGLLEEVRRLRSEIQISVVTQQHDQEVLERLVEMKVSECEQNGNILETLLFEQIDKGNEKIEGLQKVLLLNQDYAFAAQQAMTLEEFYAVQRKFDLQLKNIQLELLD